MSIKKIFIRIFSLVNPYKSKIILSLIGMIVTALTEPALAGMMKILVDEGFTKNNSFPIWIIPVFGIGIFLIRGISTFTTNYMMSWVSGRVVADLRLLLFEKMLDVSINFISGNKFGKFTFAMMNEAQQVFDIIRTSLVTFIRDSLTIIGLMGYLFWLNWKLTLVTVILVPLLTIIIHFTTKRLKLLIVQLQNINSELARGIRETVRAQKEIKMFGGENFEKMKFKNQSDKLRRFGIKVASTMALNDPISQLITSIAISTIITLAISQANQDTMSVGDFASFITAMIMLMRPLKRLAGIHGPLQRGIAASKAVFDLIDSITERQNGKKLLHPSKGKIEFRNVFFKYPNQSFYALKDINLTVKDSETIALVGISGCGKTTLINLIPEFFKPLCGEIFLDDQPISSLNLNSLRKQISLVSQNIILFDDSLASNIAYGDLNPDIKKIEEALSIAYLDDVVDSMSEGLNTIIGDNGVKLSGGQRQRVAIARAIYKDAPILILDEATSSLDSHSESNVQKALEKLIRNTTTILISHRISTIENSDRIIVLQNGQIKEIGSHNELMKKNGIYSKLNFLQN